MLDRLTPMFATHSDGEMRVGGALVLTVSLTFLYGTIRHFDWMKRKVPFLLRWGRGSWGFPASRFGCVAGSVVGIAIGSLCFDRSREVLPRSAWGTIFGIVFATVLVAAMYDFWLWRKGRQRHIEPREPIDVEMPYTPNHISLGERIFHIVVPLALIGYGLVGLLVDDLYLPGKRRGGIHLHGTPALLMFMAMLSAAATLLSVVVDHYDKRNNERYYYVFARVGEVAGWTLFGLALVVDLYLHVTR